MKPPVASLQGALLNGMTEAEYLSMWKSRLAQASTDWLLCKRCDSEVFEFRMEPPPSEGDLKKALKKATVAAGVLFMLALGLIVAFGSNSHWIMGSLCGAVPILVGALWLYMAVTDLADHQRTKKSAIAESNETRDKIQKRISEFRARAQTQDLLAALDALNATVQSATDSAVLLAVGKQLDVLAATYLSADVAKEANADKVPNDATPTADERPGGIPMTITQIAARLAELAQAHMNTEGDAVAKQEIRKAGEALYAQGKRRAMARVFERVETTFGYEIAKVIDKIWYGIGDDFDGWFGR